MKKFAILMSYVLIAAFMVSCSNDTEEQIIQQPEGFTASDLSEIRAFKNFAENSLNQIRPVAVNAIKRNRAKTRGMDTYTPGEMTTISQNLEEVGQETVSLFEKIGVDIDELNEICPIDQSLALYGMVGLEVVNALDLDEAWIDDEPDGCEIIIPYDPQKMLNCLFDVLGIDLGDFVYSALAIFKIATGGTATITKRAAVTGIKAIFQAVKARADLVLVSGAIGIGLMVLEWTVCYVEFRFDAKSFMVDANNLKLENSFLVNDNNYYENYMNANTIKWGNLYSKT